MDDFYAILYKIIAAVAAIFLPFLLEASRRAIMAGFDWLKGIVKAEWLRGLILALEEAVLAGDERAGRAAKEALVDGRITEEEFKTITKALFDDCMDVAAKFIKNAPRFLRPFLEQMAPRLVESILARFHLDGTIPTVADLRALAEGKKAAAALADAAAAAGGDPTKAPASK